MHSTDQIRKEKKMVEITAYCEEDQTLSLKTKGHVLHTYSKVKLDIKLRAEKFIEDGEGDKAWLLLRNTPGIKFEGRKRVGTPKKTAGHSLSVTNMFSKKDIEAMHKVVYRAKKAKKKTKKAN
jgi:hypothetical protein